MDEQPKTFQLSSNPDPHHHQRVLLYGLGTLLLIVITGSLGYIWAINNNVSTTINTSYSSTKITDMNGWKTYTNPQIHYSLEYPSTWSIDDLTQSEGLNNTTTFQSDVRINSNSSDDTDIHIMIDKASKLDMPIKNGQQIQLDGNPAIQQTVTTEPTSGIAAIGVTTVYGKNIYRISLESSSAVIEKYKPIFTQVLSTFKFNE